MENKSNSINNRFCRKWLCVVLDNYSEKESNVSKKLVQLVKTASNVFGHVQVVRKVEKVDEHRAAAAKKKQKLMFISSGSDMDPTAEAGGKILKVLRKQVEASYPSVLVCWTFQSVLMKLVAGSVQRLGRKQVANSFHSFRGTSVASFHNFGAPASYLPAVCSELQRFLRSQAGPARFCIESETYVHFGQGLISFLCVQPLLYMSQFHPEVPVQGRPPLVESWIAASLALETHRRVGSFFNTQMDLSFTRSFFCSATTSMRVQKETSILKVVVLAPQEAKRDSAQDLAHLCNSVLDWAVQNLPTKWLSSVRSKARKSGADRVSVFFTPCARIRHILAPGNLWPRASDINSGFQPENLLHVHLFRKTGAFEVLSHEVLHIFLPPKLMAEVCPSPVPLETFLAPGSVFRPEEAFIELLSNIFHIQRLGGAVSLVPGLRNLEKWLKAKCSVLAAARRRSGALVKQQSCVFSYFFLRSALLKYVLNNCKGSSRTASRFVYTALFPLKSPDLFQHILSQASNLLLKKDADGDRFTLAETKDDEGVSPPVKILLYS